MEFLEPRREMGVVVRGSLSKGLEVKLHASSPIEALRAGRFVVIEGQTYDFFSMITDIALGATNPEVLDTPPDRDDVLMHAVLAGTSTFGTVSLRPMIQLRREGERQTKVESRKSMDGHSDALPAELTFDSRLS